MTSLSRTSPSSINGDWPEDVWDWFEKSSVRTVGVVSQQTAEVQARIRAACIDEASHYAGADGISILSPALLFAARKPSGA
jgi:hypothetical protein